MELILLVTISLISLISLITIFILLSKTKPHADFSPKFDELGKSLSRIEVGLKEEFRLNREEGQKVSRAIGIMVLPFEGLYSEVVRKSSLMEELHRDYKISITGPSTLAAHLNCLQMGFKTLTIQKRSSEVWKVLGAVKTEFDKFGGLLEKSQKHFQAGVDDLDSLIGTRTRMIKSKLKSIEALTDGDKKLVLPETLLLEVDEEV